MKLTEILLIVFLVRLLRFTSSFITLALLYIGMDTHTHTYDWLFTSIFHVCVCVINCSPRYLIVRFTISYVSALLLLFHSWFSVHFVVFLANRLFLFLNLNFSSIIYVSILYSLNLIIRATFIYLQEKVRVFYSFIDFLFFAHTIGMKFFTYILSRVIFIIYCLLYWRLCISSRTT